MLKRRVFISNKNKNKKMQKRSLLQSDPLVVTHNKIKLIKPRVKFTDGSVVDLQSLIFRFNSSLTLT
jgi:hypothetical protein